MIREWLKTQKSKYELSAAAAAIAGLALYLSGVEVETGWITYVAELPALVILILTALARVNDISPDKKAWIWQVRRVGLSFVGVAATALAVTPFTEGGEFPSWRDLMLIWGMAMTWLSTPGQPPWSKYITGKAKLSKEML